MHVSITGTWTRQTYVFLFVSKIFPPNVGKDDLWMWFHLPNGVVVWLQEVKILKEIILHRGVYEIGSTPWDDSLHSAPILKHVFHSI